MEPISTLLAHAELNSTVNERFPLQRASDAGFDITFDVNPIKCLVQ